MVTAMDDAIGKVVETLQDKKMWENTLLVFSTGWFQRFLLIKSTCGFR